MNTGGFESGDMMVVTVRVPTRSADELSVTATDGLVRVVGPGDFHREVRLADADLNRLQAQLFRGILELRAPHTFEPAPPNVAHAVLVEPLP
jgi:HSP20 family molecular chaperone IbpA